MLYKKLLKNIENKSIIKEDNTSIISYNGISPINVDNENKTISIDLTNIDNKQAQQDTSIELNKTNIQANTNEITSLKTKEQEQDNKITNNTTNINNLINELKTSNIINYVGEYQQGTTYKLGQVVSFNNKMYLVKVQETTNEPTNTNDYDLLSAPEIDLSNYYNKAQIDTKEQDLNTKIETNKNELKDLYNQEINHYQAQQALNQQIETKQQEQDQLIQDNHNDINDNIMKIEELLNKLKEVQEQMPKLELWLTKGTIIGVNSWDEFRYMKYPFFYNENGEVVSPDNTDYVSNNLGSYGEFSKSYEIKQNVYKMKFYVKK